MRTEPTTNNSTYYKEILGYNPNLRLQDPERKTKEANKIHKPEKNSHPTMKFDTLCPLQKLFLLKLNSNSITVTLWGVSCFLQKLLNTFMHHPNLSRLNHTQQRAEFNHCDTLNILDCSQDSKEKSQSCIRRLRITMRQKNANGSWM